MARRRVNKKRCCPRGHLGFGRPCHRCEQARQFESHGFVEEAAMLYGKGKGPEWSLKERILQDREP